MTESNPFGQFLLHVLAPVGTVMLLGLLGGKGAKFLKLPDEEMMANVVAFYIHGAKDSDTPLRCQ